MWTILFLLLSGGPAGAAGTGARAEMDRLGEEMRILVEKNAWAGVERTYLKMLALQGRGLVLGWEQHRLGALAAQSRGDVLETWKRLRAAEAAGSHKETLVWLATLEATHGRVVIELSPLVFGDVPIEVLDPFSDPGAARVVKAAQESLSEHRFFDGLLPLGRYHVGTVPFDVDGGPMVRVMVGPGQGKSAPIAEQPGTVRIVATAAAEPKDFGRAAEAARQALIDLDGVASVEVLPLPGQRLYAEFGDGTLDVLGLTATEVATQVRTQLGLDPTKVSITANGIGVPAGEVRAERLSQVDIQFADGSANLGSMARVRESIDHAAQPAGLRVRLRPGVDPAMVRSAIAARLEQTPTSAPLQLAVQ
ncbi:MAG: efflux RND transporter permease subunit [Myxococcales bacterium]|nr:efflux RND transporter permease subunit [Myxococcales bacterium]